MTNEVAFDYTGLELSTRILIEEALRRGIEVEVLDRHDQFIRLKKGSKVEYVKQATRTSVDTYIAPIIMENKEVTKIILREHGIEVPDGTQVHSEEEAERYFENIVGKDIVVKPKLTNFGIGIHFLKNVQQLDTYMQAVRDAFSHDDSVMIEQFIPGKEYRFLVIGDETVAVMHRAPANVEGDGKHTIKELVEIKNKDPLRGEGHTTPLEKIQLGEVELEMLRRQGKDIHYVPEPGETVFLRENSNISTGGDSIDYTDEVHEGYKQIAVQAMQAVGAKICGADFIIHDIHAEPKPGNYSVIELNFNPAMYMHRHPYKGKKRYVEKKVLDLLGFTE